MTSGLCTRTALVFALTIWGCRTVPKRECSDEVYLATKPPSDLLAGLPNPTDPLGRPGTGSILGYLEDSASGLGIPHAVVAVIPDSAGQPPHYALTDSAGGFLVSDLTPGSHSFYTRRVAYDAAKFEAIIRTGQVDTVRLRSHLVSVEILCSERSS
jgi:hypothetical protein